MIDVAPLAPDRLAEATGVLAAACAFDPAAAVAAEKLFGTVDAPPVTLGAWHSEDNLVGVAAVDGRWLRLLAVVPGARGQGVGSALLAACEDIARKTGVTRLSVLDRPGNYLAPGIDERNVETLAWLERRGFTRGAEARVNVLISVRDNPRVTPERLAESIAAANARGYEVRRATVDERDPLTGAIASEFGGTWPHEVARALAFTRPAAPGSDTASTPWPAVHVATRDGAYCAFAAHDGNNTGLGWFGPTGTWPAHRGQGLGEAVLLACLLDVALVHAQCEVAWIGPRPFYDKVAGIAGERRFTPMFKVL